MPGMSPILAEYLGVPPALGIALVVATIAVAAGIGFLRRKP